MTTKDFIVREKCSLCRSDELRPVLDLGQTPLANEYVKPENSGARQKTYPLNVVLCDECGHSQIGTLVDPRVLFGNYTYATSTSEVTRRHLSQEILDIKMEYATRCESHLDEKSFVLEIGSNDGAMLDLWKKSGINNVFGVDPASSKLKAYDVPMSDLFFDSAVGRSIRIGHGPANVVVANNVFAHVPDVLDVAIGVNEVLAEGGMFVFEVSYLLDMFEAPLFDTIYHEHTSYHAIKPLALMLDKLGMPIRKAVRIEGQVGRGSLRVYAQKGPGRSIESASARGLMAQEARCRLWESAFWEELGGQISKAAEITGGWIETLRSLGERVAGYGAAAKLTTLMYTFGLDRDHIEFIVDDSKWKQGMLTPGTKIPVVGPEALLRADSPRTCVIFAWNFAESIAKKNLGYKGRFVIPLPMLKEM